MKIAITGHSEGIGLSLSKKLQARGHHIVGISRSGGHDIRDVKKIIGSIDNCDLFINNAHAEFGQVNLFVHMWHHWQGKKKYIWNISTQLIDFPINCLPRGESENIVNDLYRIQKIALEESSIQLGFRSEWPKISIIRPGLVNTKMSVNSLDTGSDPDTWAESLLQIFLTNKNLHIPFISLVHANDSIPI